MTPEFPYKPAGISCREVVEIVTDYLEGDLSPQEREQMEEHLRLCPPCQSYVDQIRTTATLAARAEAELERHPDRDALLTTFRRFLQARGASS